MVCVLYIPSRAPVRTFARNHLQRNHHTPWLQMTPTSVRVHASSATISLLDLNRKDRVRQRTYSFSSRCRSLCPLWTIRPAQNNLYSSLQSDTSAPKQAAWQQRDRKQSVYTIYKVHLKRKIRCFETSLNCALIFHSQFHHKLVTAQKRAVIAVNVNATSVAAIINA